MSMYKSNKFNVCKLLTFNLLVYGRVLLYATKLDLFILGYMHLHFRLSALVLLSIFYLLCYHVFMQILVAYNNTKPWSTFRLQLFFLFAYCVFLLMLLQIMVWCNEIWQWPSGPSLLRFSSHKRILIQYSTLDRLRRVHVRQNWIGNLLTCESDHVDEA